MGNLSSAFDWSFFWGVFGTLLKLAGPFVMVIVAIVAVGMLLLYIIKAVRQK